MQLDYEERAISHEAPLSPAHQPVILRWKIDKIIPIPKKDKTHRPISLLPVISKVMEILVLARVK